MYTRAMATQLVQRGHEVVIIAGADGTPSIPHSLVTDNNIARIISYELDGIKIFCVDLKSQSAEDIYRLENNSWTEEFRKLLKGAGLANAQQLLMNGLSTVSGISLLKAFMAESQGSSATLFVHTPFLCPKGDMIYRKTNSRCMVTVAPGTCGPCMMSEYSHSPYWAGKLLYFFADGASVLKVSKSLPFQLKRLLKLRFNALAWLHQQTARFILFSNDMKAFVLQQPFAIPEKLMVLRHGISNETFFNRNIPRPSEPQLFLYAGRFEEIKGVNVLCNAWEKLPEEPSVRQLYLAGDWKQQKLGTTIFERLKNRKDVVFIDKLLQPEIAELYSRIHCLIIPSKWIETGPLVFHEAIACGCDVISSDIGGQAELAGVYENKSILFKSDNAASLQNAILNYTPRNSQARYEVRTETEHFATLFESLQIPDLRRQTVL